MSSCCSHILVKRTRCSLSWRTRYLLQLSSRTFRRLSESGNRGNRRVSPRKVSSTRPTVGGAIGEKDGAAPIVTHRENGNSFCYGRMGTLSVMYDNQPQPEHVKIIADFLLCIFLSRKLRFLLKCLFRRVPCRRLPLPQSKCSPAPSREDR